MSKNEDLDIRKSQLSAAKKALLASRIAAKTAPAQKTLVLRPRERNNSHCSLSYAQQRLWFLDELQPGLTAYNVPAAVRLRGSLDAGALARSLTEVVRRHEALRSTFANIDGSPVQIVGAPHTVALPLTDLSELAASEADSRARQILYDESHLPFDLSRGPLLRARLIRIGAEEHLLIVVMHHIVSDGWSIGVLVREVAALYDAFLNRKESPLPELALQYGDYAAWEREWLSGEVVDEQLSYWREHLKGTGGLLDLPTVRPRPAVQGYQGAQMQVKLGEELSRGLKELSQREGTTLFMTMLAGIDALLHRYSGQKDIVVGTPVANRGRGELEGMIGLFVNTLALRVNVTGEEKFTTLLQRVREAAIGAYAHQDLPFERVVEEVQPERTLSHAPLFQVMFIMNTGLAELPRLSGLAAEVLEVGNTTAKFDLTLSFQEREGRIEGGLEYDTELYDEGRARQMLEHYVRLLEGVATNPESLVSELPLLSEEERKRILHTWNETREEYPGKNLCVHEMFEEQAGRTPNHVAVEYGVQRLTYQELNVRAGEMAKRLRRYGVGPDRLVGVCLERSVEMVVALLGILKAGAAFLPLDPEYPQERLAFMLADSGAELVLTQGSVAERLPEFGGTMLRVDEDENAERELVEVNGAVRPESLAYVIYTSGSTGLPKGVQIPHHAVNNFLNSMHRTLRISERDILLSVTSLSFDIAVLELFLPLVVGARVTIAGRDITSDGVLLLEKIKESGATVMQATPATWWLLRDAGELPAGELTILCGGEALPQGLADHLIKSGKTLWNLYGPTETTIWSAVFEFTPQNNRVVIGRPIGNTQLYVLDNRMRPVPVGVSGELYIGGEGLARGYLNRPDLTAERFCPDPFSNAGGSRLYRTGDVVKYLEDGNVEFVGRADRQVKVRGHRIELGEVEAALSSHPEVGQCAVAVVEVAGHKQLVAYVVPGRGSRELTEKVPSRAWREYLQKRLPEYMVPPVLIELEEMPLTPSGKIDRRLLPSHSGKAIEPASIFEAPRTNVEMIVASIWSELLGAESIGMKDNFFELGGHSLLATRLLSRIQQRFGVRLPIRSLFAEPTVEICAQLIEEALKDEDVKPVSSIQRVERSSAGLPLSYAQQRLWILNQLDPDSTSYNMHAGVRLRGGLKIDLLERVFTEVVRRHETLRTTFTAIEGLPTQVIGAPQEVVLPVTDLTALDNDSGSAEVSRLSVIEAGTPFDLSHETLLRLRLLRLGFEEYILLLTTHHIVFDGWSMGVLVREVATLYDAFARGKTSPLPELAVQYADYSVWQRKWLQGSVIEEQLSYWRRQLSGAPALINLPTDRPRPATRSDRGSQVPIDLEESLTEQLKELARKEGMTLFMTLLAAFYTLLYKHSRQEDIVVGVDEWGRNRAELEPLIGFFVNMLPMRVKMGGNPNFLEVLAQVREVALGAYAHQDVPYDKLVSELPQVERSLSYSSLFQVVFVFNNMQATELSLEGLTVATVETQSEATRFDLSLSLTELEKSLSGAWTYSLDIFEEQTIRQLHARFLRLIKSIVDNPTSRLDSLEMYAESEKKIHEVKKKELEASLARRLVGVQRKPVRTTEAMVKTGYLDEDEKLPLLVQPAHEEVDLALWAQGHKAIIEAQLRKHGALLFRGFDLSSAAKFESFMRAISPTLSDYSEPTTPRVKISSNIYTSTQYSPTQQIALHNELSYSLSWPMKIWFYCATPAEVGGTTLIADSRKVFSRLRPELKEIFMRKNVMYVRNYNTGMGLTWEEVFATNSRAEVEEHCRAARMDYEWIGNTRLRTRQVRQAVMAHPATGEMLWFNQAHVHHLASLPVDLRESLLAVSEDKNYPLDVNACFGDGSPIEDSIVDEIRSTYEDLAVSFPWQKTDVLMLDNMLVAHGRTAFQGPREVLVAMAEPFNAPDNI